MKRTWLIAASLLVLAGCSSSSKGFAVGSQAPAFSLEAVGGKQVSLAAYQGKQPVLLFFSMGPG